MRWPEGLALGSYSRIQQCLDQIDHDVSQNDHRRRQDGYSDNHGQVLFGNSLYDFSPQAGQSKNYLGDDSASQQRAQMAPGRSTRC